MSPIGHGRGLGSQSPPEASILSPVWIGGIVEGVKEPIHPRRPGWRTPPVTAGQTTVRGRPPERMAWTPALCRCGELDQYTVGVLAVPVQIIAGQFGKRRTGRESAVRIHQPPPDPNGNPVGLVDLDRVQRIDGRLRGESDVRTPSSDDLTDPPGAVRVDAQHVAITEPAVRVPVLHRAVAPCAVDHPNRDEIEDGAGCAWINPHLMAQHRLQQSFLPRWGGEIESSTDAPGCSPMMVTMPANPDANTGKRGSRPFM